MGITEVNAFLASDLFSSFVRAFMVFGMVGVQGFAVIMFRRVERRDVGVLMALFAVRSVGLVRGDLPDDAPLAVMLIGTLVVLVGLYVSVLSRPRLNLMPDEETLALRHPSMKPPGGAHVPVHLAGYDRDTGELHQLDLGDEGVHRDAHGTGQRAGGERDWRAAQGADGGDRRSGAGGGDASGACAVSWSGIWRAAALDSSATLGMTVHFGRLRGC